MARNSVVIVLLLAICACNSGDTSSDTSNNELTSRTKDSTTSSSRAEQVELSEKSTPRRYRVRDGHITYRYSGLQEGSEEVYFTDYGMVEVKFTKTTRDNPFKNAKEVIDLTTLMRDSAIYVVDNSTNNARRIDNSLLYESALESSTLDLDEVAEQIYRSKGGTIVDTQNIAGVPAEKWQIPEANTTEWRWKGIMMKTIVDLPRALIKVEALSIDTASPLPEGVFELSTDVNVQEGMSMKEWIEAVTKPIENKQYFDREGNRISRDSFRRIK